MAVREPTAEVREMILSLHTQGGRFVDQHIISDVLAHRSTAEIAERRRMSPKYARDFARDAMALYNGKPSTYPSVARKQQYFAWRLWKASASVELKKYLAWYLRQLRSMNASVKVPPEPES